ncbi:MAG TPA: hypothetical protein VFH73_11055 [Polyangia bacterium]|jgi:hypothetical protein|nr:hypothetical protein [Polyangia bacterium]
MTIRRTIFAALTFTLLAVACDSDYPVSFICEPNGGADCPAGKACPTVPLGSGGCEDLPGLFGHQPTKVPAGRPRGCRVDLSYGNPYYGDTQQICICASVSPMSPATWGCPV